MFQILDRKIGINEEPFIIAELSANHGGSLNTAIETFVTDSYGDYELSISETDLPEVYTIKFQPGGTDISTGKTVNTVLSSTSTKENAITSGQTTLN